MVRPRVDTAVFSGMHVAVDDCHACVGSPFVGRAGGSTRAGLPDRGSRSRAPDAWHRHSATQRGHGDNVLVNFHGQTTASTITRSASTGSDFLIDMTGEPTDIRLMLPARTRLVENEAFPN